MNLGGINLDFLSRHPLPVTGNDDTEMLKAAITTEHAVVQDYRKNESRRIAAEVESNHPKRKLGKQQKRCTLGSLLPSRGRAV